MSKKGFLMSLDAMLALSLLSLVALAVYSQGYENQPVDSAYLRSFSMGMLTSMEKSGLLVQSLSQPAQMRAAINSLPPNICARLTLMNYTNATVMETQKEGCAESGTAYVTYRTFYTNRALYIAKSTVWSK